MNQNFENINKFIESFLKKRSEKEVDKFISLNEKDYYMENKSYCKCHYPGCKNEAIGSHTYPRAFLKKISNDNKVYAINIKSFLASSYYKTNNFMLWEETNINASGVQPLFCSTHDTEIFKRIESPRYTVNLETYLYLFLYRLYIFDFLLESEVYEPRVEREINRTKDYAKKITNESAIKYLSVQNISKRIIQSDGNYSDKIKLKEIFDGVFYNNAMPTDKDFNKYFILKYYDLEGLPDFFASGNQTFSNKNSELNNMLPSICAIVPDKDMKTAYFCILTPKESQNSIHEVCKDLDKAYAKKEEKEFKKYVEFILLEASQNIIITKELYRKLESNGGYKKLEKIFFALLMDQLPIRWFESRDIRLYAIKLLNEIELI